MKRSVTMPSPSSENPFAALIDTGAVLAQSFGSIDYDCDTNCGPTFGPNAVRVLEEGGYWSRHAVGFMRLSPT